VKKCVLRLPNEIFNCSTIEAITLNEVKNKCEVRVSERSIAAWKHPHSRLPAFGSARVLVTVFLPFSWLFRTAGGFSTELGGTGRFGADQQMRTPRSVTMENPSKRFGKFSAHTPTRCRPTPRRQLIVSARGIILRTAERYF
jgi:hypothetical protein